MLRTTRLVLGIAHAIFAVVVTTVLWASLLIEPLFGIPSLDYVNRGRGVQHPHHHPLHAASSVLFARIGNDVIVYRCM